MIRPIVRDPLFLSRPSRPATLADAATARDLEDTLKAHRATCLGMAANMIGASCCLIAVALGPGVLLMYNPVIVDRKDPYQTRESCLSLDGSRPATRYKTITVTYQDRDWKPRKQTFSGLTAQIIQHETDHLAGILI